MHIISKPKSYFSEILFCPKYNFCFNLPDQDFSPWPSTKVTIGFLVLGIVESNSDLVDNLPSFSDFRNNMPKSLANLMTHQASLSVPMCFCLVLITIHALSSFL